MNFKKRTIIFLSIIALSISLMIIPIPLKAPKNKIIKATEITKNFINYTAHKNVYNKSKGLINNICPVKHTFGKLLTINFKNYQLKSFHKQFVYLVDFSNKNNVKVIVELNANNKVSLFQTIY